MNKPKYVLMLVEDTEPVNPYPYFNGEGYDNVEHFAWKAGVAAQKALGQPVDIDALTQFIADRYKADTCLTTIKQAISQYIKAGE
jgi:hypothetical protein